MSQRTYQRDARTAGGGKRARYLMLQTRGPKVYGLLVFPALDNFRNGFLE